MGNRDIYRDTGKEVPEPYPEVADDLGDLVGILEGEPLDDERLGVFAEILTSIRGSGLYQRIVRESVIEQLLARWDSKKRSH